MIANRKILFVTVRNYEMQKLHRKQMKRNESKGFDQIQPNIPSIEAAYMTRFFMTWVGSSPMLA